MKLWASVARTVLLLAPGLALMQAQIRAQATKASAPKAAKSDYSTESIIFDSLNRVFRYAADGTGMKDITGVVEIRDQAAVKNFSVLPFGFASNSEHVEIDYVRVRHADGTVVETPASDAQEQPAPVTREAPFYSDLKEEQIPVRSLREGDHLEYHLRLVRTKPEAPGHFWGTDSFFSVSNGFVVLSESVELRVPRTSYVNAWSPKFKPTVTTIADETVYHWQSSQLQPVAGKKPNELLRMENDPTLGTNDDPKPPDIAWTNFHTWAEVGAWYRSLEGSRTEGDDDTRARVATLIAGKTTDEEKARAIYGFVASQLRYIGVALGIGRYQPHDAGDILRNQYGDCKDKTTLLASMLATAGIPTDAVLIGVSIPYVAEVPSPGSFNHAINLTHVGGKAVWLDSTSEVAPYNFLQSPIRGKKALVIPLTGEAHIETTPADPPFPGLQTFEAVGTLDDKGTSNSHMTYDLRGDDEIVFRQAVRSISPAQWDQFMQQVSQSMGYAGKVSNAKFSKPDDTSTPFHITYDYEREKSGDWDNLRIIPQLAPIGLADADEKDPPVKPIELGVPQVQISHAVMQLPKGWRADLPAAVHTKTSFATIDKTYKFDNGTLTVDRRFVILQEKVPAADWKIYHQWYKDSGLESEPYVQLYSGSANGSTTVRANSGDNNPLVVELLQQAFKDVQQRDWAAAKGKLDQAKSLNPGQPRLWVSYAVLAQAQNNSDEVIADYKRELTEHPEETQIYNILAGYQVQMGKTDDAIATLQSALVYNPADVANLLYLVSLQDGRKDYAGAVKALRAGLTAQPDNAGLKLALGSDLIKDGKKDEGVPMLEVIIDSSQDPLVLNNAAYALGDAAVDLPLAEKAARHALDLLDTASNNGETGPAARRRAELIVNTWDTLGWILYKQDKAAEAEPWVRAAWRNGNGAEPGSHLVTILQKLNRSADAQPEVTMLDRQKARTYILSRGNVKSKEGGWATIEIDVTAHGNTAVRFIDGDESLSPLASAIQRMNFDLKLPPESKATLVRRGVISCHTSATCQVVLIPTGDASRP